MNLRQIVDWLEERKVQKRRRIVYQGLKDLHDMTVTIHGRVMLTKVCNDSESDLDPEIRRMYWVLLQAAPIEEWSNRN